MTGYLIELVGIDLGGSLLENPLTRRMECNGLKWEGKFFC